MIAHDDQRESKEERREAHGLCRRHIDIDDGSLRSGPGSVRGPPYPSVPYQSPAPAMPGNGQLQGRLPGRTPQQPYSVPAPVPHPGQDQSHFSPDPGSPQLGPPLGGYDAPARRSEPDHTELETCFFRCRATAGRGGHRGEVDGCLLDRGRSVAGPVCPGGIPASSCASIWGGFATDAEKATHGSAYQRNLDWAIENGR